MDEDLKNRITNSFIYHPPFGDQVGRYSILRNEARCLAMLIAESTPESREQRLALTKLEEAVMWANAAIARNEQNPDRPAVMNPEPHEIEPHETVPDDTD